MIKIEVNDSHMEIAKEMANFGALNNSITKGKANLEGMLGEVVVAEYMRGLGYDVVMKSTKDYDMIISGYSVDVKTKRTNVPPLDHYNCDVAETSLHQNCRFYIFTRILYDMSTVYILGYIGAKKFFTDATHRKKGDDDDGFTIKANRYSLPVSELHQFTKR